MNRKIYPTRKTFVRYDDERYLLYLNEEVLENHIPDDVSEETPAGTYYAYTGTEEDGGTLINAKEASYEAFVSGLVRTRYSADQVEAILLNVQSGDTSRITEFQQELGDLNAFRQECKNLSLGLLE